jgi:hypothetical protein
MASVRLAYLLFHKYAIRNATESVTQGQKDNDILIKEIDYTYNVAK